MPAEACKSRRADGIVSRIAEFRLRPLPMTTLFLLAAALLRAPQRSRSKLVMFDLDKLKETELGDGRINSADNKMLVGREDLTR